MKKLIKLLETVAEELDQAQETDEAQNNEELMWEIGEAIGFVNNALDLCEENTEPEEEIKIENTRNKVYVVTHCAAEENYTPSVYINKQDAVAEVKRLYDECMENKEYIDNEEFWTDGFEVVWKDDTYDRVDIFEVDQQ